jgi:hypothetical protein
MYLPWTMRARMRRVAILLCVTTVLASPAAAQVDQQRAQEFFKDVQAVCEREGKRLWGIPNALTIHGAEDFVQPRQTFVEVRLSGPEGVTGFEWSVPLQRLGRS